MLFRSGTTKPTNPTKPDGNKGEEIPATGTTKPTEPTNPNGDGNGNTNSPQTGDNSNLWLWFAVLFLSAGMLIGTSAYSKKKKYSK